jgi:hypothetical protein
VIRDDFDALTLAGKPTPKLFVAADLAREQLGVVTDPAILAALEDLDRRERRSARRQERLVEVELARREAFRAARIAEQAMVALADSERGLAEPAEGVPDRPGGGGLPRSGAPVHAPADEDAQEHAAAAAA